MALQDSAPMSHEYLAALFKISWGLLRSQPATQTKTHAVKLTSRGPRSAPVRRGHQRLRGQVVGEEGEVGRCVRVLSRWPEWPRLYQTAVRTMTPYTGDRTGAKSPAIQQDLRTASGMAPSSDAYGISATRALLLVFSKDTRLPGDHDPPMPAFGRLGKTLSVRPRVPRW
jgi:hypothetical protein